MPRRSSFGNIIQRGPREFVIRWWEGKTHKKKRGFTTRKAAAEALARVRVGLGDGTLIAKRKGSIGFDEVARQWLDLHSRQKLRSHRDNENRYRNHLKPFFADCPLNAIDAARILELRSKLQISGGLALATVNLVLALLRSILNFAVTNGHISSSPMSRLGRGQLMLSVPKFKMAPPIEKSEDVWRLLGAVEQIGQETKRNVLLPFFATLVYTGIRRGEAFGLRWGDVDLDRSMLTIRQSYTGMTKSGKQRLVPIAAELRPILKAYGKNSILKAYGKDSPAKTDVLFPNDYGKMFSHNASLPQHVLWEALRRIDLPRIRVHDLRHVFASHFMMAGGDIFVLQQILGHSSVTTTADTYAHLSPKFLARETDRIVFGPQAAATPVVPAAQDSAQIAPSQPFEIYPRSTKPEGNDNDFN